MIFVAHRINSLEAVSKVPPHYGIEVDIRDSPSGLIVAHDPWVGGVSFSEFIKHVKHRLLIINVKSFGLEQKITDILNDFGIENYFFLDSHISVPYDFHQRQQGCFSGRVSEFECPSSIVLSGAIYDWVWIDCFSKFSLSKSCYKLLKEKHDYKLCLTSPDLLGRPDEIEEHAAEITRLNVWPDAICTKLWNIDRWKVALNLT
jgi:hypothetical protein